MNQKRAQELIKHMVEDKDNGTNLMKNLSLSDSIYLESDILNNCILKANEIGKDTDANYFAQVIDKFRPVVIDKIKKADRLWVVYCDSTGYPYELDKDMLVLFDYVNHKEIIEKLEKAGFKITIIDVDSQKFKNEVSHMYRNGYKSIRFIDGKCEPFVVAREELYSYLEFFDKNYITNPALQQTMISFFQEFRKKVDITARINMLESRQENMIKNIQNAEFMVPCTKTETDEEVQIMHPFIDLSDKVESKDGKPVIAIPAFTDGFELDKCYIGKNETMLFNFKELVDLIEELDASGIIINCLGISYFMGKEVISKFML
ncbi:SseB family protein [[Clostridium] fimetarium]|uniref:SseB protein N-terminal domain-containing protein n=1 Tax=[Clostridium] fimetarium TaxID=99656 RepID=A0A1I0NJI2_9FIRM|nr:SseB family protein [[Clostridium] fimetarium]SEW01614.1 SseB protein N-terminal domain-containing protein [[Clostridium] fimetarium]